MNIEEAKKSIDEIVKLFQEIEKAYDIDLTRHVQHCFFVKDDLDDAVWKAEHKDMF